ncbi:hypothetical protein Tco_1538957 [Tanacetum coccineum]
MEEIQVSVTQKKPNQRCQTTSKKKPQKEKVEDQRCHPWTFREETTLCKGWVRTSKDSVKGNARKERVFGVDILYKAGDTNYLQRALTGSQVEYRVSFTLLHCWEEKKNKRYKSSRASSFNMRESGEGSTHLNTTVGDEEDEVEEVHRPHPMGGDQAKRKM